MTFSKAHGACILSLALSGLASGCQSLEDPVLCGQIPEGGCPAGRGGTCDDVLCAGLYDCGDGDWVLVADCPDPGSGGAGGGPGAGGSGGSGGMACTPVELDHEGETIGCTPDLQHPDCPVAAAETCAETACLSDCADFFMCVQHEEKEWTVVAWCDERAQLVIGGR
jgi:hypothetical protein